MVKQDIGRKRHSMKKKMKKATQRNATQLIGGQCFVDYPASFIASHECGVLDVYVRTIYTPVYARQRTHG